MTLTKNILKNVTATISAIALSSSTALAAGGGASSEGDCGCDNTNTPGESNAPDAITCGAQHLEGNLYVAWASNVKETDYKGNGQRTIIAADGKPLGIVDKYTAATTTAVVAENNTRLKPINGETLAQCAIRAVKNINGEKTEQRLHQKGTEYDHVLKP